MSHITKLRIARSVVEIKVSKYNAIIKFKCPKLVLNPIPLDSQADALPVEPNRNPRMNYHTNRFVVQM